MYKPKYRLNKTLSILSLIISALTAINYLATIIVLPSKGVIVAMQDYVIIAVMLIANCIIAGLSVIVFSKIKKQEPFDNHLIAMSILVIISILIIIIHAFKVESYYTLIELLIYSGLLTLTLIAIFKKGKPNIVNAGCAAEQNPANSTLGDKISQFKRMRELCLISDEELLAATDRLIEAELIKETEVTPK